MGKQNVNWWIEVSSNEEITLLDPGEKRKRHNPDKPAFYFLTLIFILVLTVWLFKKEILQLLF